jgi:DNA-binding MarR family transcriptional regulator
MNDKQPIFDVDRVLHEPARLMITTILYAAEEADFLFLLQQTGLTKGNLSAHLSKLEKEDYVEIEKTYRGKVPQTLCRLTKTGRKAFEDYRRQLNKILKEMK